MSTRNDAEEDFAIRTRTAGQSKHIPTAELGKIAQVRPCLGVQHVSITSHKGGDGKDRLVLGGYRMPSILVYCIDTNDAGDIVLVREQEVSWANLLPHECPPGEPDSKRRIFRHEVNGARSIQGAAWSESISDESGTRKGGFIALQNGVRDRISALFADKAFSSGWIIDEDQLIKVGHKVGQIDTLFVHDHNIFLVRTTQTGDPGPDNRLVWAEIGDIGDDDPFDLLKEDQQPPNGTWVYGFGFCPGRPDDAPYYVTGPNSSLEEKGIYCGSQRIVSDVVGTGLAFDSGGNCWVSCFGLNIGDGVPATLTRVPARYFARD